MLQANLLEDDGILVLTPGAPLTEADFKAVAAIVDPYIEAHDKLNGLLIHADQFPGWENFSAFVTHLKFIRDHQKHIAKVAAVSDSRFLEYAPNIASHFIQAEVKHFPASEYEAALAWIKA